MRGSDGAVASGFTDRNAKWLKPKGAAGAVAARNAGGKVNKPSKGSTVSRQAPAETAPPSDEDDSEDDDDDALDDGSDEGEAHTTCPATLLMLLIQGVQYCNLRQITPPDDN